MLSIISYIYLKHILYIWEENIMKKIILLALLLFVVLTLGCVSASDDNQKIDTTINPENNNIMLKNGEISENTVSADDSSVKLTKSSDTKTNDDDSVASNGSGEAKKTVSVKKNKVIKGKYKNKNVIVVKVNDGKKIIKVKCKYKKSLEQYLGEKKKNGKRYYVNVVYEARNGMQMDKKGWWTIGHYSKKHSKSQYDSRHDLHRPVTKLKLHY